MAADDDLDQQIADLYGVAPEEFVLERDALAKALRAAGRKDEAAEIKKLRRPSRTVWALRRAALDEPQLARSFHDAVDAVARAQGGRGNLREQMAALRSATADLAAAAAKNGVDQSDASGALLAIATDPDAVEALAAGRLDDLPAGGMGGLGGGDGAAWSGDETADATGAARDDVAERRRAKAEERRDAAADELKAAAAGSKAADRALRAARDAFEAAERDADRAATREQKAQRALDDEQQKLDRLG